MRDRSRYAQGRFSTSRLTEVQVGPAVAGDPLRVATGTYTGTGADQRISLPFTPDIVMIWGGTQPVIWRNRTAWHGRAQRFDTAASDYHLTGEMLRGFEPFDFDGFGVLAGYSVSGQAYQYAAIRTNGSANLAETSYIGNETAGRNLLFMDVTPDATLIKRDSSKPAVVTLGSGTPELASSDEGAIVGAVAHVAGGVTLGAQVQVNQNNGGEYGEGHEILAFVNSGGVSVLPYIGNGSGARSLGIAADVALIVPVTASGPASVIATTEGASGISGEAVNGVAVGSDVTVPASYNATGVEYRVIALRDGGAAIASDSAPVPAHCGLVSYAQARLTDAISISGACSYEFWGRSLHENPENCFTPLLMCGNGADQGTDGWNLGLYGHRRTQYLGWQGSALKIIQGKYLSRDFTAPNNSLNLYNTNTGVVMPIGRAAHYVVTHNGAGLWRLYENGHLVKEHHRSLTLEGLTDGGEGVAHPLHVFGAQIGGTFWAQSGEIYRAQVWNAALTGSQVRGLWDQINGRAASVPVAAGSWDFTSGVLPGGVSGIAAATPIAGRAFMPAFSDVANAIQTVLPNGDVSFRSGTNNGYLRIPVPPGSTWELRTVFDLVDATVLNCRVSDLIGAYNNPDNLVIFTHTKSTNGALIDRTDTFTVPDNLTHLHYRPTISSGKYLTIKAGTRLRRIS